MGSSDLRENKYKIPKDHANTSPNQWKLDEEGDPGRRPRAEPTGKKEKGRIWSYSLLQGDSCWDMCVYTHVCPCMCMLAHMCPSMQ